MDQSQRTPNVWVVRADGGEFTKACVDGGCTGIGWEGVGNLTDVADKDHLARIYVNQPNLQEGKGTINTNVSTIWRFANAIKRGDWVITPGRNPSDLRYGKVSSDYFWLSNPTDGCRYSHRKRVEWASKPLERGALSQGFQRTLTSWITVFRCSHVDEFLERIGERPRRRPAAAVLAEQLRPYELAIERILTLNPTEFEQLIGHLLAAMGFEIEVTQPVSDGGVDFRGVLNVSNAAQVAITGQVKRYQPSSKITARPIRDLRGRIPIGSQGTFVTTSDYTKDARRVAEEDGFARVGLINGEQLIDLLTQHWQAIPDEFRDALSLKPILVPA